ncbi:MAG: hypothetical protein [Olavius algarvensis Gamma 1 endosymbiont]|nr:MAG: hypothetical protein [Olavius algarvensis Gamma 1 endosymbiont]
MPRSLRLLGIFVCRYGAKNRLGENDESREFVRMGLLFLWEHSLDSRDS